MIRKLLALLVFVAITAAIACSGGSQQPAPSRLGLVNSPVIYTSLSATGFDASATTYIGPSLGGFDRVREVNVDCSITTGTGDASVPLDVYLQKLVSTGPNIWVDFVHFPRQSITLTSAKATYNVASAEYDAVPVLVGVSADDASTPALDAGYMAHGHPGSTLRLVVVTGAGVIYTSAAVACYFVGHAFN